MDARQEKIFLFVGSKNSCSVSLDESTKMFFSVLTFWSKKDNKDNKTTNTTSGQYPATLAICHIFSLCFCFFFCSIFLFSQKEFVGDGDQGDEMSL
jgi:hypothetical protein